MGLSRRSFFRGAAGVAAGILLPATLEENVEDVKRIYALGAVPAPQVEAALTGNVNFAGMPYVLSALFGEPTVTELGDGAYQWEWNYRYEPLAPANTLYFSESPLPQLSVGPDRTPINGMNLDYSGELFFDGPKITIF